MDGQVCLTGLNDYAIWIFIEISHFSISMYNFFVFVYCLKMRQICLKTNQQSREKSLYCML